MTMPHSRAAFDYIDFQIARYTRCDMPGYVEAYKADRVDALDAAHTEAIKDNESRKADIAKIVDLLHTNPWEVPTPTPTQTPRLAILVVRDPDGANQISIYLDGQLIQDYTEISLDAGAGYGIEDWIENAKHDTIAAAQHGEAFAAAVKAAYDDPPGTEYIDGWDDYVKAPQHYLNGTGECTGCEHDCPWKRTNPAPLGAPFCTICDDHNENRPDETEEN
jgi:hypothetical protein